LRETIEQHVRLTASPLAEGMLENWSSVCTQFRKVLPRDYARVMAIIDQAKIDGVSDEETSRRVMEPVNG
jgi:glutamate synthase (NADPH/NADH) large chain